jgi:hypothetical protein
MRYLEMISEKQSKALRWRKGGRRRIKKKA